MNEFNNQLSERLNYLKSLRSELSRHHLKDPHAHLRTKTTNNHSYYYSVAKGQNGDEVIKYLNKSCLSIARKLAQYDYEEKIKELLDLEIKALQKLQKVSGATEDYYDNLNYARKELIKPIIQTDKNFVEEWEAEEYSSGPSYDNSSRDFRTEKGELVRSKSELIIANKLNSYNVPYKYEKPIRIKGITYYPDFTVLNKRTRKEYIWEHFGMLDNLDYIEHNLRKYDALINCGFVLGKNLIISHESSNSPLKLTEVTSLIESFCL